MHNDKSPISDKSNSDDTRTRSVDLKSYGIDEVQAAELRAHLITFAEDWESPQMDVYDNYDTAHATL